MDIDWKVVGAAGSIIAGIAVVHGLSNRKWQNIHTFGVALGITATVGGLAKRAMALRTELTSDPQVSVTPTSGVAPTV